MNARARHVVVALTAAQRALVASEPGLASRAVKAVFQEYGPILPRDEALQIAETAVQRAAQTFDAAKGTGFGWWGFWVASKAILFAARVEHREHVLVGVLRGAFLRRRALEGRFEEPEATSFEEVEARLAMAPKRLLNRAESWVDEMLDALFEGSEERIAEKDQARTAARALRQVYEELKPTERRLLSFRFADELTMKEVAKKLGVGERTIFRKMNPLLKRV